MGVKLSLPDLISGIFVLADKNVFLDGGLTSDLGDKWVMPMSTVAEAAEGAVDMRSRSTV